ncbi:MAG: T9SS type A sorting domain-containing protein [Owenweeksia sp.]
MKNSILLLFLIPALTGFGQYQQSPSMTLPNVKVTDSLFLPYLINGTDTCVPFLAAGDSLVRCLPLSGIRGDLPGLKEVLNNGATYSGDSALTLATNLYFKNSSGQTIFKTDYGKVEIGKRLDSINSLTPLTVYAPNGSQDVVTFAGNSAGGAKIQIQSFDPDGSTRPVGANLGGIDWTTPYFDTINQRAQVASIYARKTGTGRSGLVYVQTTNNRAPFPDVGGYCNIAFRPNGQTWLGKDGFVYSGNNIPLYKSAAKLAIQSDSTQGQTNTPLIELRHSTQSKLNDWNARFYQDGNFKIQNAGTKSEIMTTGPDVLALSSLNGTATLQLKNLNDSVNASAGDQAGKIDFITTLNNQYDSSIASIFGYYKGAGTDGKGGIALSTQNADSNSIHSLLTPEGYTVLSVQNLEGYTSSTALPSTKTLQVLNDGGAHITGNVNISGNTGIGTFSANPNSSLELADTNKGFLVNRLTTAQRTLLQNSGSNGSPLGINEEGLMIYDTDADALFLWDGTAWLEAGGNDGLKIELFDIQNDSLRMELSADTLNSIDLSPYLDNTDAQQLSLSGDTLSLENGGTVNLGVYRDNTDAQELALSTNLLSISGGMDTVDLSTYLDNTDAQQLSLSGDTLSLENGGAVNLDAYLDNTDAQELALNNNLLSVSGGMDTVDLSTYLDNTDSQTLSLNGTDLSISNGNMINLSSVQDGTGTDDQHLQNFTLNGTTLSVDIEDGNSVQVDISSILVPLQNQHNAQQLLIDDLIARVEAIEDCACGGTLGKTGSEEVNYMPVLHQNIPNPANGDTKIGFFLPVITQKAQLIINSNAGQLIAEYTIGVTGEGEITIPQGSLSAGVYYYSLFVNDVKVDTKKMIIR